MTRRQFSREFKVEAVRLVQERGVSVSQASRDLDVGESLFRRWLKEFSSDPGQAFPGQGQLKPEQQEIERLRREVAKLKAERDILKKAAVGSTGRRNGFGEGSSWCPKAKCFPWPVVELECDRVEVGLAVGRQVGPFWEVLP